MLKRIKPETYTLLGILVLFVVSSLFHFLYSLTGECFIIGLFVGVARISKIRIIKWLAAIYVDFLRGTPLLVQIFLIYFALPELTGIKMNPFVAAIAACSINSGAYVAEIFRAGIQSIDNGQMEAGECIGMSYMQIMRRILLPQALRISFPTLANSIISMVKDTSLAANITVTEMFMATQRIVARTYEPLALYIEVGIIYLIFCTVLTKVQRFGEKKLGRYKI